MNENRITSIQKLFDDVANVGGARETTKIVPNIEIIESSPSGLSNYIIVKDENGYYVPAIKMAGYNYTTGAFVNLLYIKGTEPIAFMQGSDSTTSQVGFKNNFTATVDPTVNDDIGDGYAAGSIWINITTPEAFILMDSSVGAANWDSLTAASAGAISTSIIDAKGDLIVGTADNTVARLAVGPNNYFLTADSTQATGIRWVEIVTASGYPFTVRTVDATDADADYSTITSAITAASAGDVILIGPGTYSGLVTINKAVVLRGVDRDKTILTYGTTDKTVSVATPGVIIENLTINHTSGNGSCVKAATTSDTFTIRNCNLSATGATTTNIGISTGADATIDNCIISAAGTSVDIGVNVTNTTAAVTVRGGRITGGSGTFEADLYVVNSGPVVTLEGPALTNGKIGGSGTVKGWYTDGSGGQVSQRGTSFPGSPATGQQFFRTDLGWLCYYDGTRWLTNFEQSIQVPATIFTGSTAYALGSFRTDYAVYVTRVRTSLYIDGTNNGSNYWTVAWRGINAAYNAATTIRSETTSADSGSTWIQKEAAATIAAPANNVMLDFYVTKTGSPGNAQVVGTLFYRIIVT